jgi:hypothetical protein
MTKHAGLRIRQVGRNCQRCNETFGWDVTFGARDWYQPQTVHQSAWKRSVMSSIARVSRDSHLVFTELLARFRGESVKR